MEEIARKMIFAGANEKPQQDCCSGHEQNGCAQHGPKRFCLSASLIDVDYPLELFHCLVETSEDVKLPFEQDCLDIEEGVLKDKQPEQIYKRAEW